MTMKRMLYSILTLAVLGSIAWLSSEIAATIHERKAAAQRTATLPRIELARLDGRRLSTSARPNRPTMLLFFRTTCPYCRDEIADLIAHRPLFDEANVLLISGERPGVLRRFSQELDITERSNFIVAIDERGMLAKHYDIRKIPAVFVYDDGGALVRRFDGLAKAAAIAAALGSDRNFDARHVQVP